MGSQTQKASFNEGKIEGLQLVCKEIKSAATASREQENTHQLNSLSRDQQLLNHSLLQS
jgi:hypothetical protein